MEYQPAAATDWLRPTAGLGQDVLGFFRDYKTPQPDPANPWAKAGLPVVDFGRAYKLPGSAYDPTKVISGETKRDGTVMGAEDGGFMYVPPGEDYTRGTWLQYNADGSFKQAVKNEPVMGFAKGVAVVVGSALTFGAVGAATMGGVAASEAATTTAATTTATTGGSFGAGGLGTGSLTGGASFGLGGSSYGASYAMGEAGFAGGTSLGAGVDFAATTTGLLTGDALTYAKTAASLAGTAKSVSGLLSKSGGVAPRITAGGGAAVGGGIKAAPSVPIQIFPAGAAAAAAPAAATQSAAASGDATQTSVITFIALALAGALVAQLVRRK